MRTHKLVRVCTGRSWVGPRRGNSRDRTSEAFYRSCEVVLQDVCLYLDRYTFIPTTSGWLVCLGWDCRFDIAIMLLNVAEVAAGCLVNSPLVCVWVHGVHSFARK